MDPAYTKRSIRTIGPLYAGQELAEEASWILYSTLWAYHFDYLWQLSEFTAKVPAQKVAMIRMMSLELEEDGLLYFFKAGFGELQNRLSYIEVLKTAHIKPQISLKGFPATQPVRESVPHCH